MKSNLSPKVSVLMPVYKTPEPYLRQAIESILGQTFDDFEFLILDDCPSSPVEGIVKTYNDKRIKYFKNDKNLGISPSRNKLIDLSKGQYLAVMDHDDVALSERLEKEVNFLDANPDVGVVGTWYENVDKKKIKKKFVTSSQIERHFMFYCAVLHTSAMMRKSVLLQNNIRYEAEFTPAEDYALFCRLIGKTKFANIPEDLQKYRWHESNTSKNMADEMQTATQKIYRFVHKEHPDLLIDATKTRVYKIFGLPVLTIQRNGSIDCCKLFGLFKYKVKKYF